MIIRSMSGIFSQIHHIPALISNTPELNIHRTAGSTAV